MFVFDNIHDLIVVYYEDSSLHKANRMTLKTNS